MDDAQIQPQPLAVLTRPFGRNAWLLHQLQQRGWCVKECPALEICRSTGGLGESFRLDAFALIVFVSRAAVENFHAQLAADKHTAWPAGIFAACMGPATADSIRKAFGSSVPILYPSGDATQDSEALWPLISSFEPPLKKMLIVRGQDGREWLSQRLRQAGWDVAFHQAYTRKMVDWPKTSCAQLLSWQLQALSPVWLLTSAHGVEATCNNLDKLGVTEWLTRCRFVFTHDRFSALLESRLNQTIHRKQIVVTHAEEASILQGFDHFFGQYE